MADVYHDWRNDLQFSATGDLRLASGATQNQQHLLRRLLTSRGGYLWTPTYGVGLGSLVGQPVDIRAVEATIRLQLRQEASVAVHPPPEVSAGLDRGQVLGTYSVSIRYHDAVNGTAQNLSIPAGI